MSPRLHESDKTGAVKTQQTSVSMCVYIYMCVCVHIYIYIYIYAHTHEHTLSCGTWHFGDIRFLDCNDPRLPFGRCWDVSLNSLFREPRGDVHLLVRIALLFQPSDLGFLGVAEAL